MKGPASSSPTVSIDPAPDAPPLRHGWLVVALLWPVGLLNYLDRMMLTTMRGSIVEAIPMSDAQFGLLTATFLWIYGLLSPFAGFMADRFSRARLIAGSLLVWSVVTWLTAHAHSFEALLVTRALMGLSEACYIPAALALCADYHPGRTRSLANSVQIMGIFVGQGLGGLGGIIAERAEWTTAFSLFGWIGIGYFFVLLIWLRDAPHRRLQPEAPADRPRLRSAIVHLLGQPAFLLALSAWGLLGLANWAVAGWMPTHLATGFGLPQGRAGMLATGCLQAAALGGVLLGGWWADRWRRRNPRAPVLVPFAGMLIALPAVLLVANAHTLSLALAGLVVYGGVRCFADANMMPILCMVADERHRATGYGILNCFSCLVGGLAIYAGGLLRDAHVGLDRIFNFAALCVALTGLLLWMLRPGSPGRRRPAGA